MIHPDTKIKTVSKEIGVGVFATKFIPKGTIIVVHDAFDIYLKNKKFEALPKIMQQEMETYMYRDQKGHFVLSWDHARYMNHNCDSNTLMTNYEFEIAVRDINTGEEISSDYGLLNVQKPYKLFCRCNNCRGMLNSDDFDNYSDIWDKRIIESFLFIKKVPQPLESILSTKNKIRLEETLQMPELYSSVINLKCFRHGI